MPRDASLGIRVDGENVVSRVVPGGAAARHGRLRVGDRVLSVDGQSLRGGRKLSEAIAAVGGGGGSSGGGPLRLRVLPARIELAAPRGGGGRQQQQHGGARRSAAGGFGGFGGGGRQGMGGGFVGLPNVNF